MSVFPKSESVTIRLFCLAAAIFTAPPLQAQTEVRNELGWTASVGGDVRWFDWREHQDDKQLLMETGPLGAVAAQVRLQYGHAFSRLDAEWGGGLAHYDGHLQSGPEYESDAWEEIIDSEWQLGWQEPGGSVHIGLMQRDWRRYIEGGGNVSSAEERYRWRLLTVGGEYRVASSHSWQIALAAKVGRPFDSYQKVYSPFFDDTSLSPGSGTYWRIAVPLQGQGDNGNFSIEPYYQQQNMAQSKGVVPNQNGVPLGFGIYQPASIRRELGISLLWRFGGNAAPP